MSSKKFTPFDWINEIKGAKRPWNTFTQEQHDAFNSYLTHKSLSYNDELIELVNYAQGAFNPQDKRGLYAFYCEFIPRDKRFYKWIKSKKKQPSNELVEKVAEFYQVGRREAKDYVYLMDKKHLNTLLEQMGVEVKQIKKLLKW